MYKKRILVISVLVLLIIEFSLIFLMGNTLLKEESKNEKATVNNKLIAVMLEQSDGTYKESNVSKWPEDMAFNSELSGCTDINGNVINNALLFDVESRSAQVLTSNTSNCYLYFDRIEK